MVKPTNKLDALQKELAQQIEAVKAAKRMEQAERARTELLTFIKHTRPDPQHDEDPYATTYEVTKLAEVLSDALEKVARGEILYLLVSCPPQFGKSELITRRFLPWYTGKFPHRHVMFGTYSQDLANVIGDEVRTIVNSPEYAQVFPEHHLRAGSKSKEYMVTDKGGKLSLIGRGGAGTGKPADCLPGETIVLTDSGQTTLEEFIKSGCQENLVSFDLDTYTYVSKPVLAWSVRDEQYLIEFETESGKCIRATGNHRIFVEGRGYVRAEEIQAGDRFLRYARNDGVEELRPLRKSSGDAALCVAEENAKRHQDDVLQSGMPSQVHGKKMSMWQTYWKITTPFLFCGMQKKIRVFWSALQNIAGFCVSRVRGVVSSEKSQDSVLFKGVRKQGAFKKNGWKRKFTFQRWNFIRTVVQSDEQDRGGEGCAPVRCLQLGGDEQNNNVEKEAGNEVFDGGSSHRPRYEKQPTGELDLSVRDLPFDTPQIKAESVRLVRKVRNRGNKVYDIQVEGTECFFADSFLVHNCWVIDDPIKDDIEAQSSTIREATWQWFTKVVFTRCHALSAVIIVMTRWSDDDLIGRLTDKSNPHYKESIAKKFTYINIPAIIDTPAMAKALKCKVGDSLWPERFPVTHLETARDLNPLGFNAMYMGRPTPPEGAFFKRDQFMGYQPNQLPKSLRHYLSGDLAISPERDRDKSCVGHWGLDTDDTLWLLPDLYWEQKAADEVVEDLVQYGKDFPIFTFFGEKGQIQKSIGPFLEKRMREEGVHFNIELFPTTGNKGARAVSFRGRMAQGKVRFPTFAPWWPKFFEVMLKFTGSGEDREDDPADMCGLIGQGLGMQVRASGPVKQGNVIRPGTLAWVKQSAKAEKDLEDRKKRLRGM